MVLLLRQPKAIFFSSSPSYLPSKEKWDSGQMDLAS